MCKSTHWNESERDDIKHWRMFSEKCNVCVSVSLSVCVWVGFFFILARVSVVSDGFVCWWWHFDVKCTVVVVSFYFSFYIHWSSRMYEAGHTKNRNAEKSIPIYLVENFQEKYQRYQPCSLSVSLFCTHSFCTLQQQTENCVWPIARGFIFYAFMSPFKCSKKEEEVEKNVPTASIAQMVFAFGLCICNTHVTYST